MEFQEGQKVSVQTKDHKRNGKGKNVVILRTSQGIFMGFHGEKSAKIRFFRDDGSYVDQTVLISRINAPVTKEQ